MSEAIGQHKRMAMGQKLAKGGKVVSGALTPVQPTTKAAKAPANAVPLKKGGKCC